MKKSVYITGALALCTFVMSGVFKILQLIGAPTLLLSSGVFTCLFIISFAIYKFNN